MVEQVKKLNKELVDKYYDLIQSKVGAHPTLHNLENALRISNSVNNIRKDTIILSNKGWVPLYDKHPFVRDTLKGVTLNTIWLHPQGTMSRKDMFRWDIYITPIAENFIEMFDNRGKDYAVKKYKTIPYNSKHLGPRELKIEIEYDARIFFESIDELIKEVLYRLDIGKEW